MRKRTTVALAGVGLLTALGGGLAATPAHATDAAPYTLVLWSVPNGVDPNSVDQDYVTSASTTNLDALDEAMKCGSTYQVDLYRSALEDGTPVSSLWADGKLHPNHDGGFLAYDVLPTPYKVVTTDPCPEPSPTPTPTTKPVAGVPVLTITPNDCPPNNIGPKTVTWDIPEGLAIGGVTGKGEAIDEDAAILRAATSGTGGMNQTRSWVLPITVLDGYTYEGPDTITLTQTTDAPNGDPTKCEEPTTPPTDEPTTPTPTPTDEPTTTPTPTTPVTVPTTPTATPTPSAPGVATATPTPQPTTPAQHRGSSTPSAVPVAADTSNGELAYTGMDGDKLGTGMLIGVGLALIGLAIMVVRHRLFIARRRREALGDDA